MSVADNSERRHWWSLRRPAGVLFWATAFVVFGGFVVPLIHANRFRTQIQTALEQALGRQVEIGEITLRLLPAPGFQLENVIVAEDPAFGTEHFAYMTAMTARLRLRTLWTGQVQLASLLLVEPSLNLVKNAAGRWNFEALLERGVGRGRRGDPQAYFPYIGIDDGRVNFKFGDQKSLFHVREVEAAISPPRDAGGRWWMRLGGQPARTDHVLSGMGRVRAEGSLVTGAQPAIQFEMGLEESAMSYLLRLARGTDYGVHGTLAARLRLSGELSRVRVEGTLEAGDVHRWDIHPGQESRLQAPFRGEWDVPGQKLALETTGAKALRARLRLESYLSRPQWNVTVELAEAPAAPLVRMAQHFGAALPADLELKGSLDGRLEFAGSVWPAGAVKLREGRLAVRQAPPIEIAPAELTLADGAFDLAPTAVRIGKEAAEVAASGRLESFRLEAVLATRGARLEALRSLWSTALETGTWEGRVFYRKEAGRPGEWSGAGVLSSARWQPQGLASPVEIAQAKLRWDSRGLQLEALSGAAGETRFTGSCRLQDGDNNCRLRVKELALGSLDRWWNPAQKGNRWAGWKRALGLESGAGGGWIETASVQGSIQADRLLIGRWEFRRARSEIAWKAGTLVLSGLRAELGKGSLSGAGKIEWGGAAPRYSVQAAGRGIEVAALVEAGALPEHFQAGSLDARMGLTTTGRTAAELRAALVVQGVFEGRSLELENVETEPAGDEDAVVELGSLAGQFQWSRAGLELSELHMSLGKEAFEGRGSIGGRRAVSLEMASGRRHWRLLAASAGGPVAAEP